MSQAPDATVLVPAPAEELCLSFANTRYWRGSEPAATEQLATAKALGDWLAANARDAADAQAASGASISTRCSIRRDRVARGDLPDLSRDRRGAGAAARRPRDLQLARWRKRRNGSASPHAAARIPGSWQRRRIARRRAGAGDLVGRRPFDARRRPAHPPLRQRQVPVGVHRSQQGRHPPLVRHELVRQPRQVAPPLRANQKGLTPSGG